MRSLGLLSLITTALLLSACQRTHSEQRGYRGLAMFQLARPSTLAAQDEINRIPKPLRAANKNGPTAAEAYQNVQVLGDLSKQQLARLMLSFKTWVAPDQGCGYCHNAPDYASDEKYPKRVAREMIRMTRHINNDWTRHVAATGVTCFTCHRGQPVPAAIWFTSPARIQAGAAAPHRAVSRPPTPAARSTALPNDPLSDYLLHDDPIRVVGPTALQTGNRHSINQAKDTYSLMMVMSESLGVNCTFCHNTRAFASWELSTPQRATAWYGIRMARDLNNTYMAGIVQHLPADRLGPTGDGPKVYCATCHRGSNKPLAGAQMLKDYPELLGPTIPWPAPPAGATPAEAPTDAPARSPAGPSAPVPVTTTAAVVAVAGTVSRRP